MQNEIKNNDTHFKESLKDMCGGEAAKEEGKECCDASIEYSHSY